MSEKSPVRLRVYQRVVERVGEDSGVAEKVRTRYAVLYRWMQATRQRMPEIVEFNERQFVLEDQILGLILRAKLRRNDDTGLLDQQRSELVNQFIQNNLAGREKRLDRLRMMIQEEERRLARDRENLDRARDRVNQRFDSEFGPLVSRAQDLFDDEADVPVVLPTTQPSK